MGKDTITKCWRLESRWVCMQKRINIAYLRLLSLEMPAYKVGPWMAFGNLDFGRIPIIP